MNARIQITIDPEMSARARQKAADQGISFAEYVRCLIDSDLGEEPKSGTDVSAIFDLVTDGPVTNIGRDKYKMIGEAAWQNYLRKTGRK